MSTIRALILVVTTLSTLAISTATGHRQGTIGPQKLTGPSIISTSFALHKAKTTPYNYTVTLNHTSTTDTVCSISDAGGHMSVPSSVTVPANSLTQTFPVTGVTDGYDTMTVYNAFSSASCNVTITSD